MPPKSSRMKLQLDLIQALTFIVAMRLPHQRALITPTSSATHQALWRFKMPEMWSVLLTPVQPVLGELLRRWATPDIHLSETIIHHLPLLCSYPLYLKERSCESPPVEILKRPTAAHIAWAPLVITGHKCTRTTKVPVRHPSLLAIPEQPIRLLTSPASGARLTSHTRPSDTPLPSALFRAVKAASNI